MFAAQLLEGGRRSRRARPRVTGVRLLRAGSGMEVELCTRCAVAGTPVRRMRGLLGRRGLDEREGLLIRPCGAVHTWFMRFAIDAVFLDRDGVVVGIAHDLRTWRIAGRRGAVCVLELGSGTCARFELSEGDRLAFSPARGER